MSFKDQLRNYFVCLWQDFWFVPPRQLVSVLGCIALVIPLVLLRLHSVFQYSAWFHAISSLLNVAFFLLFGYSLYKKLRRFYEEKMR